MAVWGHWRGLERRIDRNAHKVKYVLSPLELSIENKCEMFTSLLYAGLLGMLKWTHDKDKAHPQTDRR